MTLLALAALIVAFVVTWLTIPAGAYESKNLTTGRWETARVAYPAELLRFGLRSRVRSCEPGTSPDPCAVQAVRLRTDLDALRSRVLILFGAGAAVVVLVGVALGALRGY